jgi:tetratricopeptide (TPR) repeat protein
VHDYAAAEAEFRAAIRLEPDDANAHTCLGLALHGQGKLAEEVAAHREAIRLKPDDVRAYFNLGLALSDQGKVAETIAAYREVIRLKPEYAEAHTNLGRALGAQGKLDEAIAEYREAIRLKPDLVNARANLGNALRAQGKFAEAIAAYREAIRLKPDAAEVHSDLGCALSAQGKLAEAIAEFRAAVRIKPDDATAHYNLGIALSGQGRLAEATAAYREAIRLQPEHAEAHCNLGMKLQEQGQFREALVQLRRGHELGSKRRDWPYPSERWVSQVERMVARESRFLAVLRGDDKPKDAAEALDFAQMMQWTQHYVQAARLYRDTFAAHPELADGIHPGNRYDAACAAARAGAVQGQDKPPLDEPEKARWRKQALDWLREHLAMHARQLEDPKERGVVPGYLRTWHASADLAGIRDEVALAKLPGEEQKAFTQLWADVAALLKKASTPGVASLLEQLPEARKALPKDSP